MYRISSTVPSAAASASCAELAPEIFEVDDGGLVVAPRRHERRPGRPRRRGRLPDGRDHGGRGGGGMSPRTIVIVGAGLAGARAAETLRADGYDGRVLLVGEEPVAPYERPALSKEFLAGKRDETSLLLRKPRSGRSAGSS